jgi:hypothetical protein
MQSDSNRRDGEEGCPWIRHVGGGQCGPERVDVMGEGCSHARSEYTTADWNARGVRGGLRCDLGTSIATEKDVSQLLLETRLGD